MKSLKVLFSALILTAPASQPALAQMAATAPDSPATPRLTVAQLREKYADRQSRYVTVKGMDIHYKDEGPRGAPVLLLIHGSQSSLRTWDRITLLLKQRYRIVRFDIPGYGLSSPATDEAAKTVQPVEITEGLLEGLGVKKLAAAVGGGGRAGGGREVAVEEGSDVREQVALEPAGRGGAR